MGLISAFMTSNVDTIKPAIEQYSALLPAEYEVHSEFAIWKHKWTSVEDAAKMKTAVSALQACQGDTLSIIQVLATLPVTTAEWERTFSRLERTATAIRSMNEDRLEALILLLTHLDITPKSDDILNKFAIIHA